MDVSRRALVQSAAWSMPVVLVSAHAAHAAVSLKPGPLTILGSSYAETHWTGHTADDLTVRAANALNRPAFRVQRGGKDVPGVISYAKITYWLPSRNFKFIAGTGPWTNLVLDPAGEVKTGDKVMSYYPYVTEYHGDPNPQSQAPSYTFWSTGPQLLPFKDGKAPEGDRFPYYFQLTAVVDGERITKPVRSAGKP